jgi:hypothetical protein
MTDVIAMHMWPLPNASETEPLRVRNPCAVFLTLHGVWRPPPLRLDFDPGALLLEERRVER